MNDNDSGEVGIEAIQAVGGANREAKAYAYLYAAFKRTEIGKNPVRDALDCLIPFVAPYLNSIQGKQATLDGIQENLKASFGFEIPLYAVEQMLPELQAAGLVSFEKPLKIYKAIGGGQDAYRVSREEIETDFDALEKDLEAHALGIGFADPPPAGTWGAALVQFLRGSTEETPIKIKMIKGSLVEPKKVEIAIVGGYIKRLHESDPDGFDRLVKVFMGVLIEDFISSVSEVTHPVRGHEVIVFLDTAILLRLLGCSGNLHRTAAEELVRYLQDTGFQTYFLPGNETEVAGILEAIIFAKDSGRELEGETAAAISAGEVSVTQIRMLKGTFPEVLAAKNVFSADALREAESTNQRHQIDEPGFSEYLKQESKQRGRLYGLQNRENDAGYLGTVMRVRAGARTRDISASKCVFVTSNKFLAYSARKFLLSKDDMKPQHCPPILSVGQIATIVWLLKDQKIAPERAARDLLANCYAAIRPDQQWFKHFREGMDEVGAISEENGGGNPMLLQAARRIAQEESFSEAAIVRELNMAEILQMAQQEIEENELRRQSEREREIIELEEASKVATKEAVEEAVAATRNTMENQRLSIAESRAESLLKGLKYILLFLSVLAVGLVLWYQVAGKSINGIWWALMVLGILDVAAIGDLLGMGVARRLFQVITRKATRFFLTF